MGLESHRAQPLTHVQRAGGWRESQPKAVLWAGALTLFLKSPVWRAGHGASLQLSAVSNSPLFWAT